MNEELILKTIADNPLLMKAVRDVFERQFQPETARADDTITDTQLGQMYRARIVGLQKIDQAMREISKCKSVTSKASGVNPAR